MPNTAAIVLAGGLSTRMGTNKAALVVDGSTMLDRVLSAVSQAGIDNVVIVGPGHVPDAQGKGTESDTGRSGPMAGVVGGWRHLRSTPRTNPQQVAVLACDLPGLTAVVLRELATAAASHTHGAVAHDGERPQPLLAVYNPRSLDLFDRAFSTGERSVRRCSKDWDLAMVSFDERLVADADTPADLQGFTVEWPG